MMLLNSHDIPAALDRNHLHKVRHNFFALNQFRLHLAREALNNTHRLFFDALPALFHFNHPMLPGYCLRTTPAGLYDFQLTEATTQQLRKFAKSFHPNRHNNQRADIISLFAMGSLGTIAQNTKSDIDIWLCHRPELSQKSLDMLEQKAQKISAWAETLHLDMTVFLMNPEDFLLGKNKDLNKESSGNTQHFLLLDEFYRTALHLGGQLPIWLFINAHTASDYVKQAHDILEKKLLPEKTMIDFGSINKIPPGEFISAAIWQLYKAITSPYKSIIKLLLIEAYASLHPKAPLLCDHYKTLIHEHNKNDDFEIATADPYINMYRYIESYLIASKQADRIPLLRRCFYLKIIKTQKLHNIKTVSIRDTAIETLINTWQWNAKDLHFLENQKKWSLKTIMEERHKIIDELNHSYYFIMDFFRENHGDIAASNKELNILGRKLHAAFSRKPGKIDWINPSLPSDITESSIALKKTNGNQWTCLGAKSETTISKTSLVELITWLHCNQIIAAKTQLTIDGDEAINAWAKHLLKHINNNIMSPTKLAEHSAFEQPCSLKKILFFIKTDATEKPINAKKRLRLQDIKHCLIDCISINSWNEVICHQKTGSLLEATAYIFTELFQKKSSAPPALRFYFSNREHQHYFNEELTELFEKMFTFFLNNDHGRYLIQNHTHYLMLYINQFKAQIKAIASTEALQHTLTLSNTHFSPISLSGNDINAGTLKIFCEYNQANSIQVFFRPRGKQADLTIVDEQGTFHYTSIHYHKGTDSLMPLHRFLRAISDRQQGGTPGDINPMHILPIHFFELIDSHQGWHAEPYNIKSRLDRMALVKLYAVAEPHKNALLFTVYNDDIDYAEANQDICIYTAIADYIYQKQGSRLPRYAIIDLDISRCATLLSDSGRLHTHHFLDVKKRLEHKINNALLKRLKQCHSAALP
ncbi:MAG: class I adenylate cyclase [Cellvibrionaceae bacterium]|nr:class I adenylate cyclase [Cellvibrionaceae bacterium]